MMKKSCGMGQERREAGQSQSRIIPPSSILDYSAARLTLVQHKKAQDGVSQPKTSFYMV